LQVEVDELLARTEEAPRRSPGLRRDGDAIQIEDTTRSPGHRVSGRNDADEIERIGSGWRDQLLGCRATAHLAQEANRLGKRELFPRGGGGLGGCRDRFPGGQLLALQEHIVVGYEGDSSKVQTSYGYAMVRRDKIAAIIPSDATTEPRTTAHPEANSPPRPEQQSAPKR
jgi:hypothetical protein